jgi:phage tail sheath protein FI
MPPYFPRTFVPDPANDNRLRSVAPSGTMAGLFARTDATRGVWKAPAGTDARLENVQDLAYLLTDLQNGVLNPLGVNCLRTFPIYGPLAWGARTLDGADQLASEWSTSDQAARCSWRSRSTAAPRVVCSRQRFGRVVSIRRTSACS